MPLTQADVSADRQAGLMEEIMRSEFRPSEKEHTAAPGAEGVMTAVLAVAAVAAALWAVFMVFTIAAWAAAP